MEEMKTYIFTIGGQRYGTGADTQMDAEFAFDVEVAPEHDTIDYTVEQVELSSVVNDEGIIWF